MLNFISKLFRKSDVPPVPFAVHGNSSQFSGEAPPIVPSVEVAQLSLAAILAKFPADLRAHVQQLPDAAVTVALPVPTILKQLPSCSVKMSVASLYRQAPAGIFKSGLADEKRMVEVPLAEIFKRVRPELLKRRTDQRQCQMPEEGFNLFGDKENPHAVALTLPEEAEVPPVQPRQVVDFGPEVSATIPEPEAEMEAVEPPAAPAAPQKPAAPLAPPAELSASVSPSPGLKMQAPAPKPAAKPAPVAKPAPAAKAPAVAASPKPNGAPLVLPIADLDANWPELIRAEVGTMNGSTVSLPNHEVTAGLAKGRVVFKWGQLREGISPPPPGASGADSETELALPLRVVAPAFLKLTKGGAESRKRTSVGEDIPSLFHGSAAAAASAAAEQCAPATEPQAAVAEPEPAPIEAPAEPAPAPAAEIAPAPAPAPVETVQTTGLPQTINELFGQPAKARWSPEDIVENVTKLPGISGAVVAMQEGLLVAHRLPEHLSGETFAAFLPQIFARLNQYGSEMKLGEVNGLTIQAHGGPCQMIRHNEVIFAVLGRSGEPLPSHAINLCAEELKK